MEDRAEDRTEDLEVEQTGEQDLAVCGCCGQSAHTVWGRVHALNGQRAAYSVHWSDEDPDGAVFDIAIGKWGVDTTKRDRLAVSLNLQWTMDGPQFVVGDATNRPMAQGDLVGRALGPQEVDDSPVAEEAFAMADAIWAHDDRITDLTR